MSFTYHNKANILITVSARKRKKEKQKKKTEKKTNKKTESKYAPLIKPLFFQIDVLINIAMIIFSEQSLKSKSMRQNSYNR